MMRYVTAAGLFGEWRESVLTGTAPPRYLIGEGAAWATVDVGPGRIVLLGGAPGAGKTALSMQWATEALRLAPTVRVMVVNVEVSPAVLLDRQLARFSGVDATAIRERRHDDRDLWRIESGLTAIESFADRLAFLESPYTLAGLAEAADEFRADLLILDYLQRIRLGKETETTEGRRGEIDETMDYLRRFADAGKALIVVSAVARGKDHKGRSSYDGLGLASFRQSSELEFGADSAYMVHPPDDDSVSRLACLKNRHGEPIDLELIFDRRRQSFTPIDESNGTADGSSPNQAAESDSTEPAPEDKYLWKYQP